MTIAVDHEPVTGTLQIVRDGRAFDATELDLLEELIAKAGHAASEIIANQVLRDGRAVKPYVKVKE